MERFHILPQTGGLDDQDLAWVDDMELYFAMKAQVQREYREWLKTQERSSGGQP